MTKDSVGLVFPDISCVDEYLINPVIGVAVKRKVVAIVQARMGSARLPGKVMKQINGAPVIELLRLLSTAELVDLIVVATPDDEENDSLVDYVSRLGYGVSRKRNRCIVVLSCGL